MLYILIRKEMINMNETVTTKTECTFKEITEGDNVEVEEIREKAWNRGFIIGVLGQLLLSIIVRVLVDKLF